MSTSIVTPSLLNDGYISDEAVEKIYELLPQASITEKALDHIITLQAANDTQSTTLHDNLYLPDDPCALGPKVDDALVWWMETYLLPVEERFIPYLYLDDKGVITVGMGINVSQYIGWGKAFMGGKHPHINKKMTLNARKFLYDDEYADDVIQKFKNLFIKQANELCKNRLGSRDAQAFCSVYAKSKDKANTLFFRWDSKTHRYDLPLHGDAVDSAIYDILSDFATAILQGRDNKPKKIVRGYGMLHGSGSYIKKGYNADNIVVDHAVLDEMVFEHFKMQDLPEVRKKMRHFAALPAGAQIDLLDASYNGAFKTMKKAVMNPKSRYWNQKTKDTRFYNRKILSVLANDW